MIVENGVSNHYLFIDLTKRTWHVERLTQQEQTDYIGGKGVGLKLFNDHFQDLAAIDPLGPENLLGFLMSPLVATGAPSSARFDGVTKSPLTGIMVTSSCGGPFGYACKTAGWDGVLIEGASDAPVTLRIHYEGVDFLEADKLWGLTTKEAQRTLHLGPKDGALVIGPAGEHLVSYANICSGDRFLGRGGMGAVMGAKNLKAVIAHGREYKVSPVLPKKFKKTCSRSRRYIERNQFSKSYRTYGTNANMRMSMKEGFAPVDNFQRLTDKRIEHLSSERLADRYRQRFSTCKHCSILCGHKGYYPDGTLRHIPEYETMGMFGPNIGNYNPDVIGQWNDLLNELGLDSISAGGSISWAMEAAEKGLFSCDLKFSRADNIAETIRSIAYREGIGEELAHGSRWMSMKYGGTDFACQVKGMELAAYDPRGSWGQGLSYAVNNRGGCHLGSFLVGPESMFHFLDPYTTKSKAFWAIFFENIYTGINSLQTCQFMTFSILLEPPVARMTPLFLLRFGMTNFPRMTKSLMDWSILSDLFWSVTGIAMSQSDFYTAGERVHVLERWMNVRMGITAEDDTLPERFLQDTSDEDGVSHAVRLEPMVKQYYELRGYDEHGIPKPSTLQRLGLTE